MVIEFVDKRIYIYCIISWVVSHKFNKIVSVKIILNEKPI